MPQTTSKRRPQTEKRRATRTRAPGVYPLPPLPHAPGKGQAFGFTPPKTWHHLQPPPEVVHPRKTYP